ncbi:MAG: threonine synthase, partial [Eubacterium sp.]
MGEAVNFVVPTGNFGNILAGYYARTIGLPVKRLICASNKNNILTDFFNTGEYNRNRPFYKTMSPSMDILISSNLERLLYDLTGSDSEKIAGLMQNLSSDGVYKLDQKTLFAQDDHIFYAGCANEDETADTIQKSFKSENYLMDPHTAVASKVYDDYREDTGDDTPTVILSTASPYKFGHMVYESIFGALPDGMDDYAVLKALSEKTNTEIPAPLKDLDQKENRHNHSCEPKEMAACISEFLK